MEKRVCIKISEKDNVAVAIYDLKKGTEALPGVITAVDIPQAHKIALKEMKKGDPVYRYGVLLGHVSEDIPLGGWINEKNLVMAPAPDLDSLKFMQNIVTELPKPARTTWMGYRNPLRDAVDAGDEKAVTRAGALCPAVSLRRSPGTSRSLSGRMESTISWGSFSSRREIRPRTSRAAFSRM